MPEKHRIESLPRSESLNQNLKQILISNAAFFTRRRFYKKRQDYIEQLEKDNKSLKVKNYLNYYDII